MSRVGLVFLAGLVLEAGCVWIWVHTPQLTAGYTANYTQQFFERLPALQQFTDSTELTEPVQFVRVIEVGLATMVVGYLLALWALDQCAAAARRLGWLVLGFAAVFRLTMLLLPGLYSTDLFSYVMYGRIVAIYGQNPYVQPPDTFAADPFLGWVFSFWQDQPSVYGPVWTDLSGALSQLSSGLGEFDQVIVYRLCLAAIEVATLGLVWWLLGRTLPDGGSPRARVLAFALFAWNPLVLFDLAGSSHNDIAMLALLLLGVALIVSRSQSGWLLGLLVMTLSALVKFTTGVAALVWAAAYVADAHWPRQRVGRAFAAVGLPLLLAAVLWWPWLATSQALLPLEDAAGGRLVINSAPDLLALTIADQLMEPTGVDVDTAQATARFWTRSAAAGVFLVYLAWEIWRLWPLATCGGREATLATIRAATRALLVLPLLVLTWVWSWYFSWSLALATLLGWRSGLTRLVVAYTLVALLIVYAHQFLNQDMSGGFVLLFALGPLAAGLAVRALGKGFSGAPSTTLVHSDFEGEEDD